MATNDFTTDLVKKMSEDGVEYLVIAIQKGKDDHKANAWFNIVTIDGADMILTTIDEVFRGLDDEGLDISTDLPTDPDKDKDNS